MGTIEMTDKEQDKKNYPLFFWKETCKPMSKKINTTPGISWYNKVISASAGDAVYIQQPTTVWSYYYGEGMGVELFKPT